MGFFTFYFVALTLSVDWTFILPATRFHVFAVTVWDWHLESSELRRWAQELTCTENLHISERRSFLRGRHQLRDEWVLNGTVRPLIKGIMGTFESMVC